MIGRRRNDSASAGECPNIFSMTTCQSISDCASLEAASRSFWLARLVLVVLLTAPALLVLVGAHTVATQPCSYPREGEPRALAAHRSGGWRGPGVFVVTEDRHIKGGCYIHHNPTMVVAFSPF